MSSSSLDFLQGLFSSPSPTGWAAYSGNILFPLFAAPAFISTSFLIRHYSIKLSLSKRFEAAITKLVTYHNIVLALWSMLMCFGAIYELFIGPDAPSGLKDTYCTPMNGSIGERMRLWVFVYYISKYYEYIDTFFLAIKAKPLTFLHMYHHSIVPLIIWTWVQTDNILCLQGVIVNTFIHLLMYTYFALTSAKFNHPMIRRFRGIITQLQILQFITSMFFAVIFCYYHFTSVEGCSSFGSFLFTTLANVSFLVLFVNFYRRSYPPTSSSSSPQKRE